jgi:hypothetical protein
MKRGQNMASKRVLQHFLSPIYESKTPSVDRFTEDDINFLCELGKCMHNKKEDAQKALQELNKGISMASKRSSLYNELKKFSQDRLKDNEEIFSNADLSFFDEDDHGSLLEQPCSHMGNIMSATTDGNLINTGEKGCCIGKYPLDANNVQLFMPTVENWLNEYLSNEPTTDLETYETLQSVYESLSDAVKSQETIVSHDPANIGAIAFVQR